MFSRNFKKIPTKINFKRSDGAPMIFFIDVISNNFPNPILPMPSRIDMVSNGYPTNFILPKKRISVKIEQDFYTYDYKKLYFSFLHNIIFYSKQVYQEITFRRLEQKTLERWWDKSVKSEAKIPSYYHDIEFLLETYLNSFKLYKETNDELGALLKYCNSVIDYCNERLESNRIDIYYNKKLIEKRMYKIKREQYYPDILEYDYQILGTDKIQRKAFVPIMIYDDLLECFLFNKMQIEKIIEKNTGISNPDLLKRKIEEKSIEKSENNEESDKESGEESDDKVYSIISFDDLIRENIIVKNPIDKKTSINSLEIINKFSLSDFNEIKSIRNNQ